MTQDKKGIMAHLGDSFFQKGKAILLYREKMYWAAGALQQPLSEVSSPKLCACKGDEWPKP